jgi:glycine betaine/proline transport system ATP-binding protein
VTTQYPILVKSDDKPVGIVTKNSLLKGIQGDIDALPEIREDM